MSTGNTGVSRRSYAKSRDISEATVRKYLTNGTLADALLPDGTIDPAKADQLLASSARRSRNKPVSLVTAKVRKLRVQIRRLDDEVKRLQIQLIHVDDLVTVQELGDREIIPHFRAIAAKVAPIVAGMNGRDAHAALLDAVHAAMEVIHVNLSGEPPPKTREPELELDSTLRRSSSRSNEPRRWACCGT